jgi:hypothetical protein
MIKEKLYIFDMENITRKKQSRNWQNQGWKNQYQNVEIKSP